MLDLKALLDKLVRYAGYDAFINTMSLSPGSTSTFGYTTFDNALTGAFNSEAATNYIGTTKAGRCTDNGDWAWKITDLGTRSLYPIHDWSSLSTAYNDSSVSQHWELVEFWGQLPDKTFTPATSMTVVNGYAKNTPSGTSSSVYGKRNTYSVSFPWPASFTNSQTPVCVSGASSYNTASDAAISNARLRADSATSGTLQMNTIIKATSGSTTYTVRTFVYGFFTRPYQG